MYEFSWQQTEEHGEFKKQNNTKKHGNVHSHYLTKE